jgi:hypothetical protein
MQIAKTASSPCPASSSDTPIDTSAAGCGHDGVQDLIVIEGRACNYGWSSKMMMAEGAFRVVLCKMMMAEGAFRVVLCKMMMAEGASVNALTSCLESRHSSEVTPTLQDLDEQHHPDHNK